MKHDPAKYNAAYAMLVQQYAAYVKEELPEDDEQFDKWLGDFTSEIADDIRSACGKRA